MFDIEKIRRWEKVYEHINDEFLIMPCNEYPQDKVTYLKKMIAYLHTLKINCEEDNKLEKRCLARAIQKVADKAEIATTMVAYELDRYGEQIEKSK
jgi:hypothetical protein